MRKSSYILILFLVIIFSGCNGKDDENSNNSNDEKPKKVVVSNKVVLMDVLTKDTITITKKGDKRYDFGKYDDKIVLVNFFATWCPPCKAEIPHLVNLQERYRDDFVIISVLLEDGKDSEEVKSFMNYYEVNYIVTNSASNFDYEKLLGGVQSIPYMAMYDKNGKFVMDYKGAVPEEMIEADIKSAMDR